jgi:hypothetical protein
MRVVFLLLFSHFFGIFAVGQGPFDGYLKGKKHLDIAPSISASNASKYFGVAGQKYDFSYRGQSVGFFAEGGLAKNLDLIVTLNYIASPSTNGIQDGGVYAKMRVFKTKLNEKGGFLSVLGASGVSFPVGNYEPQAVGAIGKRAVEVPVKLLFHWESRWHFFITGGLGQHLRLDKLDPKSIEKAQIERPNYAPSEPPNYQTFLLKIGFPAEHFYTDFWFESQKTTGGADFAPDVFDLSEAHGVSFKQIGGTFYYSENGRTGFFLSGGQILSGRNISPVRRISVGLVQKFNFSKDN